jgi:hypothetical protein
MIVSSTGGAGELVREPVGSDSAKVLVAASFPSAVTETIVEDPTFGVDPPEID